MGSRKKRKINIPMCMAFFLFCITLISIHITSGLYARYTVTGTGSDAARVARFSVTGQGSGDVEVACGTSNQDQGTYTLSVTNNSEVAVSYSISITFDEVVDESISVTIPDAAGEWSTDRKSITFGKLGELAPGAEPVKHALMFEVTNWSYITADVTAPSASKELNFTVNITAEQID